MSTFMTREPPTVDTTFARENATHSSNFCSDILILFLSKHNAIINPFSSTQCGEVSERLVHESWILLVEDITCILAEYGTKRDVLSILSHPVVDRLRTVVVTRVDIYHFDPFFLRRRDLCLTPCGREKCLATAAMTRCGRFTRFVDLLSMAQVHGGVKFMVGSSS
eukprot:SAG11_NODE_350_length_10389_cov_6.616618_4_plen_165_part_00